MIDLTKLEPGDIVPTREGPAGRYLGEDLCLVVIAGALHVGRIDLDAAQPRELSAVHDLEVLAGSVVWRYFQERRG